jgi:sigma-B regulation protein RsbU (phosphoserine phosphatase)
MQRLMRNLSTFFTAILSRRIVLWVFLSVIAIETIIFFPSLHNRERELLDQLKTVSVARIDVLMKAEPANESAEDFLARIKHLLLDDVLIGAAIYRTDGTRVGAVGESPELVISEATPHLRDRIYRLENRYDVAWIGPGGRWKKILVVRHDTTSVRKDLVAFFGRIAGLVVIISMVVTLGAMMALGPIVVLPILRLRRDLLAAGEAVRRDDPPPTFLSAQVKRSDELGEVIDAFQRMFGQITEAISHRKEAEGQLRDTLHQLEDYSRALNNELDKGREIQKNFLPLHLLELPGWEFAAYFKPARQVAGDYYDVFRLSGNRVGLVIADVCDKGVGAALFMALFRSLIRIFSGQFEVNGGACPGRILPIEITSDPLDTPAVERSDLEVLQAVVHTNRYVARNHGDLGMFATQFFGVLEPASGGLAYINAGHDPIFVLSPDGGVREQLDATSPAVGISSDTVFAVRRTTIRPGEMLFSYTDGIPEATSREGAFFGRERLMALLEGRLATAAGLVKTIAEEVSAHTGEAEQFDDITMLVVRRDATPG